MTNKNGHVYCDSCGNYLGDLPLMLHDEHGHPTRSMVYCPLCGNVLSYDDVPVAKESDIDEWFTFCWKIYPRKSSRVSARKAFAYKLPKDYEGAHQKAQRIYRTIAKQVQIWTERDQSEEFIPYMSSWLNANFETVQKKTKRRKTK